MAQKDASSELFLSSAVHVMRDDEKGGKKQVTIPAGQLASDTDLTDEEIETLRDHGGARPATADDVAAAESYKTNQENAKTAKQAGRDAQELRAKQSHEAAALKKEQDARAAEEANALASDHADQAAAATKIEPGTAKVDTALRESEAEAEEKSGSVGDKSSASRIAEQDKARKGAAPAPKSRR